MVWSCGEERKRGLVEEMHVYGGGECKIKREALLEVWLRMI